MVAKKITIRLFTLFSLLLINACIQKEKNEIGYMEIENDVLKTEIANFMQRLDSTFKYKYVMWVDCRVINDTVLEYYAYPQITFGFLEVDPFHFVCSVNNRPVFFSIKSLSGSKNVNLFFKIRKVDVLDLIKHEFPEEYIKMKEMKDNKLFLPSIHYDYPESLSLIFVTGKLTEKKMGRGLF
jgi:hypothetical protein